MFELSVDSQIPIKLLLQSRQRRLMFLQLASRLQFKIVLMDSDSFTLSQAQIICAEYNEIAANSGPLPFLTMPMHVVLWASLVGFTVIYTKMALNGYSKAPGSGSVGDGTISLSIMALFCVLAFLFSCFFLAIYGYLCDKRTESNLKTHTADIKARFEGVKEKLLVTYFIEMRSIFCGVFADKTHFVEFRSFPNATACKEEIIDNDRVLEI